MDDAITVELTDARSITVPLAWFPRLVHASSVERDDWHLIGAGEGISWPELDEDISVESLLAGRPSNESSTSLSKWLESRGK
jgi:hypothetical protein